ncbi:hypothetical protein LY13_000326 [Prauserella aidingensis]|nr:hypothetical protein [Prauserella aidingensis]
MKPAPQKRRTRNLLRAEGVEHVDGKDTALLRTVRRRALGVGTCHPGLMTERHPDPAPGRTDGDGRAHAAGTEIDPELLELAGRVFDFARHGDTDTLAAYVDAGVPVNLSNDSGDTLVMLAAYHGHAGTVAALLSRGADPNRLNDRGQSPLAGAVFKGEAEVVRALLEGCADPEAGQPSAVETARMFGAEELLTLRRP